VPSTKSGVASNVSASFARAKPAPSSPVRNVHATSSSPTFAGVIAESGA
jgi:hypothetical protein